MNIKNQWVTDKYTQQKPPWKIHPDFRHPEKSQPYKKPPGQKATRTKAIM